MTEPVRYGEHARAEPGTACILCGSRERQPYADHCHKHGWVRGDICPRCNTLMALIDRRITPLESELTLAALIEHAGRCPDCEPFGADALGPTVSLGPVRKKKAATMQIRPRLDGDPALVAEVQAYADHLSRELGTRISFNATVTVLLRRALRDVSQEHDALPDDEQAFRAVGQVLREQFGDAVLRDKGTAGQEHDAGSTT